MTAVATVAQATWNLIDDVRQLFTFPFMVNAFEAGTLVALTSAPIGWFMVLRRQTFAGHTLAVVGFPGAAGATLLGLSASLGYFVSCGLAAIAIAALPSGTSRREESAGIGVVQTFGLAAGLLFVSLYGGFLNGINSLLFGSFLGITRTQVAILAVVAVLALGAMAAIGRPLLFASLDRDVAAARGVPTGTLSAAFLLLLGLAAAAASQITGVLLVVALLVLPPAAAQRLSLRPAASLAWAVVIGLAVTWFGLAIAYFTPYPVGSVITTLAFGIYALTYAAPWLAARRRR